jgi:RTX calcium-binding nonapeptide repeat (4 copies)
MNEYIPYIILWQLYNGLSLNPKLFSMSGSPALLVIVTTTILLLLLPSGLFPLLPPQLETKSPLLLTTFPTIETAWAGSDSDDDDDDDDNDDNTPLANDLPTEDLCVECEDSKNLIQGQGLIVGTNHEDFIQGSTLDDQIFSKDVADIIFADLGTDRVYGGSGGDTIQGGPGNDQLFGEDGDDQIFGGFDDDLIVGGEGNNHLFGDIGNDVLKGGDNTGANYFDCGDGLDVIIDFNPGRGDITAGNCEIF